LATSSAVSGRSDVRNADITATRWRVNLCPAFFNVVEACDVTPST